MNISVYKHDDGYYFNNEFVEFCIDNIVELKNKKVVTKYVDFLEEVCRNAEQAYINTIKNKIKIDNANLIEVTRQGNSYSCFATSFISKLYNEYASALILAEKHEQAEECVKLAIKYNNDNISAIYNYADLAFLLSDFDLAISQCDLIISKDENNVLATYLKALSLSSAGKPEEAIEYFIKTTELDECAMGANFWAGECALYLRDYERARKYFKQASELSNFKHTDSVRGYASSEFMLENGDLNMCISLCNMIIESEDNNQVKVYEIKGNAFMKLGNIEEAAKAHATLVSIDIEATSLAVNVAKSIKEKFGNDKMMEYIMAIVTPTPEAMEQFTWLMRENG